MSRLLHLPALLAALACTSDAPTAAQPDDDAIPEDTAPPTDTDWICAPDDAVCDGLCTPVRFDPKACGDCDTSCGEHEVCDEGRCIDRPAAPPCDDATRAAVLEPATPEAPSIALDCSLTLEPDDLVTKTLELLGAAASGLTLDCQGATLRRTFGGPETVVITSKKTGDTTWERPTDITVRDCRIEGSLRVQGQGANGQAPDVTTDSHTAGHRERAQADAPTRVLLERLTITASGRIPLYLAPGATQVTLRDSTLTGRSVSTVVYLDAESAHNHLHHNLFDAEIEANPLRREVFAVDGSADNVIAYNTLRQPEGGGVFLYRNCGEGGAVRHQEPRRNQILSNRFEHDAAPSQPPVWVGSRNGQSLYRIFCRLDDGYDFGSSLDDDDYARNTVILGNRFVGDAPESPLTLDDGPTLAHDNTLLDEPAPPAPCVVYRHHAAPRLIEDGAAFRGRVCREGKLH